MTAGAAFGQAEARIVSDTGVPGGQALEIVNPESGLNSWAGGVNWATTDAIRPDDVVLLSFWAKAVDAKNESQTASIQPVRIQQSGEPYYAAAEGVAYLSRDWQRYFVPGRASELIEAGHAGVTFHMGLTPQTIRLGPAYLLRLPEGTRIADLPVNAVDYDGRAADAPWRAGALERIDRHRRAELTVSVMDAAGQPVAGADVTVRQTSHAFNFGSFVGHEFEPPETEDQRNWHRAFNVNFNTATLPIYWQDWGWNGRGSNEATYREMIRYTAGRGLPWRAHPVLWPGEDYMPERLLKEMTPETRRARVLDHVREVMSYIRDYQPLAVDMVNEVRTNRYFRDNGDPQLVADAFRLAHAIAPDLPLFVNDYGILNNGGENRAAIAYYHDWIRDMRAQGVPLGGIGFQGHFSAGLTPPDRLIEILDGFAEYGLPLHITEFDIETLDEDAQADYTRDAILAALSVPEVEAFIFWQFWEGDHWKPNAAMLRKDWSAKPAYTAWRNLVFRDLWTDGTVTTDAQGRAEVRAMKGGYVVSVNGTERNVTLGDDGATVVLSVP